MGERRSSTVTVDKYLPVYYAGASGDFNLIHIDREYGEKAGLGGNVLQGLCTMGIAANQLLGETDPGKLKFLKVRFSNPVRPLDTLTVISEEDRDGTTFKVTNQDRLDVLTNGVATFRK